MFHLHPPEIVKKVTHKGQLQRFQTESCWKERRHESTRKSTAVAKASRPLVETKESTGTQVLIPVVGGLIELFSAKHIFKDQNLIEPRYKITMEQEAITEQHDSGLSLNVQPHDPFLGDHLTIWSHPIQDLNYFPRLPFLPPVSQPNHHRSFDGSSTGSNPSNEQPSYNSGSIHLSRNGSMDRASILGDAIEYIEALQKTVKELKDKLREMEEEKCNNKSHQHVILDLNTIKDPLLVEVYQIGTKDFLLKLSCKHKQEGFMGLMEALNSLGLQVINANVSMYSGKVSNILKVEVNIREFQPKSLKDSLIKLVRQT
ncbi:basic helix-loop-helix (bHLH) DNA-binding superfamily protein [Actinidia rufa]|uniref:Basic helix-loop-helix (BHLH) DNA-binding superfamily protein n=1 Tax=Actinidia rufa TaxID=165716 RepID=A0A7J0EZG5_9ERIC|nr:basic helix-loop-helix (bHLH) DNA-binding superfamily protein [Actinidia rufa]